MSVNIYIFVNLSVCFGESLPGFTCRPLHLHPGKIRPAERNWLKPPLTVPAGRPAASVTTPAVLIQPAAVVPARQHNSSEQPLEILLQGWKQTGNLQSKKFISVS